MGLDDGTLKIINKTMHAHFKAIAPTYPSQVKSVEDLTPLIELYNTLIMSRRHDDAGRLFYDRLEEAMRYRLNANREAAELLELLFPDGLDHPPKLSRPDLRANILNALAVTKMATGLAGAGRPAHHTSNLHPPQIEHAERRRRRAAESGAGIAPVRRIKEGRHRGP
jgi:hypothetical protein